MSGPSYSSIFGGPSNLNAAEASTAQTPDEAGLDGRSSLDNASNTTGSEASSSLRNDVSGDMSSLDDNGASSDYTHLPDRPNRFREGAAKWKHFTKAERCLAQSMERLEDDDLSIHLYNAHALKRRLYASKSSLQMTGESEAEPVVKRREVEQWQNKARWMTGRGDSIDDNGKAWYPSSHWTAWPMEPPKVPRIDERLQGSWYGDEEEEKLTTRSVHQDKASTSELQQVLIAEVTKRARQMFEARVEEERQPDPFWVRDRLALLALRAEEDDLEYETVSGPGESFRQKKRRRKRRNRSLPHGEAYDRLASQGVQESSTNHGVDEELYLRPVIMADDDQAQALLRLPIHHVLSKLDDLLVSLHHSRTNHVGAVDSDSSTDNRRGIYSVRERSQSKSASKSASRADLRRGTGENSANNKRPRSASTRRRANRLKPRDWSEVLATAAMLGWDSVAINRTMARCKQLFGESMDFTVLEQSPFESHKIATNRSKTIHAEDEMYGGVHVDGFMQPIKRYSKRIGRKRGPYTRAVDGAVGVSSYGEDPTTGQGSTDAENGRDDDA